MKPTASNRLLIFSFAAILLAPLPSASAAILYWNPAPLSNEWDATSTFWAVTSGGAPTSAWVASSDAVFDQAGSYTVNLSVAQTAGVVSVSNGAVTFIGDTVNATGVSIAAGATLNTTGDRIAKTGTTPVTLDGTLDLTAGGFSGGRFIQLGGSGTIIGGFRHSGTASFSGNIQDISPASRAAILWNGGTGGTLTLSGNNSNMTGEVLMSVANSVLTLNSDDALSANSYIRFEGGTGSNLIELAASDFTRAWIPAFNVPGNGGLNWVGTNAGFYARGGNRNLTFVTATGGDIPASVIWGSNGLVASTVVLGAAAATDTLTWTNDINLNLATRTFNIGDGSAEIDAALPGVLSGTGVSKLNKTGAGTLLLSNANTYAGGTSIADSPTTSNPLRVSNSAALGTGTLTIGGGGNNDKSRLELIGGITITNPIAGMASRATAAPNFINLGGNNVITSGIGSGGGGNQSTFQSDAGKLTFTGAVNARQINLTGEGNGEFSNATFTIGAPYGVTKSGSGTWILRGAANYSGTTTISEGSLVAQRTTQLALGTGAVSVASGANLTITDHAGGGQLAYANALTLAGSGINGGGALGYFNSGLFNMSGTVAISGGTTIRIDANTQTTAGTVTFTNVISGTDGLTLFGQNSVASGRPGFALTGASTYTGSTILTSSGINTTPFAVTLSGADNRLPVTTDLVFGGAPAGNAATFDKSVTLALAGVSQELAGITTANSPATAGGYRVVGASATTATLVVNNATANTFDGVLGGGGTNQNNLAFTKNGVGNFTLVGSHTYTGNTTVAAGNLEVDSAFFADDSAVTVATGATLTLNTGTNDVVSALILGNTPLADGTYTATSPQTSGILLGTGSIQVIGGTPFDTFTAGIANPADRGATDDPDADGIANAVEFVIGGNPAAGDDSDLLPLLSFVTADLGNGSVEYLKFSFRRTDASAYLAPTVEYDSDLAGTWTTAVNGAAGVVIQTTDDGSETNVDRIDVHIPRSLGTSGKLFARLKAVVTP